MAAADAAVSRAARARSVLVAVPLRRIQVQLEVAVAALRCWVGRLLSLGLLESIAGARGRQVLILVLLRHSLEVSPLKR